MHDQFQTFTSCSNGIIGNDGDAAEEPVCT